MSYTQTEKALMVGSDVILKSLSAPSLSELKQAGFTMLGTDALANYTDANWSAVAAWVKSLHNAGFRAFAIIKAEPKIAIELTKKSASIGADVVVFDELIERFGMTQPQFLAIIVAGYTVKQDLQFIVTEYSPGSVTKAYSWSGRYDSVRVATDSYNNKSIMDLGIDLAAEYHKKPLVWLIFGPSEQTYDCYDHLSDWISYSKSRNLEALFWYVDPWGIWQRNGMWQIVAGY
jgi:hypothetical protein